jgi:hypothetical protein
LQFTVASAPRGVEVTFVTKNGGLMIRMMSNEFNPIVEAARVLKARYVVLLDEWDMLRGLPTWAVYDMSRAEKNTPVHGQWTMPLPSKTFTHATNDGAVMWALMSGGK